MRAAVVAGIGQTRFTRRPAASAHALGLRAILAALADAGLARDDVDGVVRFDRDAVWEFDFSAGIGITRLGFYNAVPYGPGSVPALVRMAALAIGAGLAEVVVAYHARGGRPVAVTGPLTGGEQYQAPFGLTTTAQEVAILTRRHMHRYGTPTRALAAVALGLRRSAARNPRALSREPVRLADYRRSAFVAEPLRAADCAADAAGAAAVVVTTAERARDLRRRGVRILASTQAAVPSSARHLPEWYPAGRDRLVRRAASELFRAARLAPDAVDLAYFYDAATPLVLFGLEDYAFCEPGESGALVLERGIGSRARPAINPNGGQLGEAHLDGMNNLVDAIRRLRARKTGVALVAGSALEPTSAVLLGV